MDLSEFVSEVDDVEKAVIWVSFSTILCVAFNVCSHVALVASLPSLRRRIDVFACGIVMFCTFATFYRTVIRF